MLDIKVYKYESPNYVEINGALQGLPTCEAVDDTLDTATVIVNSPIENLFKLWQSVKIVADGYIKCYAVADIQTKNRHVIMSNDKYEHIISLIEPTKYLEKVVCSSMSFTNRNHTLKQQMERALLNAEPVEVGRTPRFRMSQRLIDFLGNTPGEDFFFEKPLLREVLDAMLSVKNARCEVYEITDFNDVIIDYYDQAKLGKQISFVESDLINRQTVQNIELLGSNIESYADNSFSENREPLFHPSPNGWDTFKTEEATLNDNNATIKTAFPIEKITDFIVKVDFTVECFFLSPNGKDWSDTYTETFNKNVNIIRNVVDSETYNILNSSSMNEKDLIKTNEFFKQNTFFYERGSSQLKNTRINFKFSTSGTLKIATMNAIYNGEVMEEVRQRFINAYGDNFVGWELVVSGFASNLKSTNAILKLKYIPFIDAHAKISKVNYTDVPSTIISNQSDKTIDLGRYGQNLYGQINRLGNKELTIDRVIHSMAEAYDVLDYTADGYVVVARDLAYYNEFIKAHYKLTKDFNNLSEKIGIDRKKRVYNIPLESFVRDILIKNNILISTEPLEDTSVMIQQFLKTFDNCTRYPITNALVKTDVSDLFELSVASYTMATSMIYKIKFIDNYSAGMSSVGKVLGGIKQHPNPYVDDDGEYTQVQIRLINDRLATRATDYDSIKLLPKVEEAYYTNAIVLFSKGYQIIKDAYEHHQFTMQLEIISNDPNIVVGFAMARLCSLITDKVPALKLYVSTADTYSLIDNQKPKGILESNQRISVTSSNYIIVDGNSFDNYQNIKSWGITDENDNLLIGVNSNTDRVYFGWRHQRV